MKDSNSSIIQVFESILKNLVDGETYDQRPPRGPQEFNLPSIGDDELTALDQDIWGQDERDSLPELNDVKRTALAENASKKNVALPSEELLDGINVIGIVGDNKRVLTTSFHVILARVAVVNFRYTSKFEKPYFYTRFRNASSLLMLDNNIFEPAHSVHTYNELIGALDSVPILDHLTKNVDERPFRFKYDYERSRKAPSSQSLGLAVKFQHALELLSIRSIDIGTSGLTVCLKEGALFSNSTQLSDIRHGLQQLLAWKNLPKFFIGISTKVEESRVLITTLIDYPHLIEEYFPRQNVLPSVIRSFGTDTLLLKKILKPGERTGLVEYIEDTRKGAIEDPALAGLIPVTCYYHKRSKPYNFIRLEMPRFMWDADRELAESAISVALWQYELGGAEPLVIKAAREQSDLTHDKRVVEQQMKAEFEKKNLALIEFLDLQ